jgi:hypothetical protein
MGIEKKRAAASADIVVTRDGNQQFAVIDLMGRYVHDEFKPLPEVAYSGFVTRAAAEMARQDVIGNLSEHGQRYGPSEVTVEMWERFAAAA